MQIVPIRGPHRLADAGPNQTANPALVDMARFLLVVIALGVVTLIGAFVYAAFTL
jgi:hypothetical protein